MTAYLILFNRMDQWNGNWGQKGISGQQAAPRSIPRRVWTFPVSEKKWKTPLAFFGAFLGFVLSSSIFYVGYVNSPWKCSFGEESFSQDLKISCTIVSEHITTTPATVFSLSYMVINVLLCYGLIKKKLDVIYIWQIVNVLSIFALFPVAHFYVSCLLISEIF